MTQDQRNHLLVIIIVVATCFCFWTMATASLCSKSRLVPGLAFCLLLTLQGGWNVRQSFSAFRGATNFDYSIISHDESSSSSSPSPLSSTSSTNHNPCHGYSGVLHIQHGDKGAAGTAMFFAYVINYLRYAEQNNLLPWIHLDNVSHRVYDPVVHGGTAARTITLQGGTIVGRKQEFSCAKQQIGPIVNVTNQQGPIQVTVHGNGVWETYFKPVSDFDIYNNPCTPNDAYVTFNKQDITWMHYRSPESVRVWQYMQCSLPQVQSGKLHEWYGIMRRRAQPIVQKYFQPQPWLQQAIDEANQIDTSRGPEQHCLAMHVRLTDKSGRSRALLGVDVYWPYVQAYTQAVPEGTIFLGTDSTMTMQNITRDWPAAVVQKIRTQRGVLQSSNTTAVFDLTSDSGTGSGGGHHRTNTEILIDVYSMAKCQSFLHGHSGVSEAAHYINANLHDCSVDLEDPDKPSLEQFRAMLQDEKCRLR